MPAPSHQEFTVGNHLVRVYASRIDLPGVSGWFGAWSIYRLPMMGQPPVRVGGTDEQPSERLALALAKAAASAAVRML